MLGHHLTEPIQSVNRFSCTRVRIEKRERIRHYCGMTSVNSETEDGFFFLLHFYTVLITCRY